MTNQLLDLTESALHTLQEVLPPDPQGTRAVRVSAWLADNGVPAYELAPVNGADGPGTGDTVVTLAGMVVYVDPGSAPLLGGVRIDHVSTPRATGFLFRPSDTQLAERVRVALDDVRPRLQADGGDVELVEVREARAVLAFRGSCLGCDMASMTLTRLLETHLRKAVPELEAVTAETVRSDTAEMVRPETAGTVRPDGVSMFARSAEQV